MRKKLMQNNIAILLIIIIFASLLRLYRLSEVPLGFHTDEAIMAVNAYSILSTGKDTNNQFLPLQTEVFGDYNPTGYTYLIIPSILLFGYTEFAARLPGALLGIFTVILVYFFSNFIFKNNKIAAISALFMAFSPWHISLSRSSEQTVMSLFFVLLSFFLFLKSIERKRINVFMLGALSTVISYFSYFTPRFFMPVFYLFFLYLNKSWLKNIKDKYNIALIIFAFILGTLSIFLVFITTGGSNRFSQVSIFGHPETRLVMEEQIREDGISSQGIFLTRVFHNKLISYSNTLIKNYFEYFSFEYLFVSGGYPAWFSIPGVGLFYLIQFPFIVIGVILLIIKKQRFAKMIFFWMIIAPLVSALTTDDIPNVRRSLLLLPPLIFICSYGLYNSYFYLSKKRRLFLLFFVSAIFIYSFAFFLHSYFVHSRVHRNWYRNEGFGIMVDKIMKVYDNYNHVVITKSHGNMYASVLFYFKV